MAGGGGARHPLSHRPTHSHLSQFRNSTLSLIANMRVSVAALSLIATAAGVLASDVADLTEGSFKSEVMGEDLALVE